jgi:hypothetical protein
MVFACIVLPLASFVVGYLLGAVEERNRWTRKH